MVEPRSRRLPLVTLLVVLLLATIAGCDAGRPALEFVPDVLPAGTVGAAYEARIVVERTETPVGGASLGGGALPNGLALELLPGQIDTIRISGTPTQPGAFEFTVSVWCFGTNVSGQTGEQRYTITVR